MHTHPLSEQRRSVTAFKGGEVGEKGVQYPLINAGVIGEAAEQQQCHQRKTSYTIPVAPAVLSLLAFVLVVMANYYPLTRVMLFTANMHRGTYFDVYLWKLKGQVRATAPAGRYAVRFFSRRWTKIHMQPRLWMRLAFVFPILSLLMAGVLFFYADPGVEELPPLSVDKTESSALLAAIATFSGDGDTLSLPVYTWCRSFFRWRWLVWVQRSIKRCELYLRKVWLEHGLSNRLRLLRFSLRAAIVAFAGVTVFSLFLSAVICLVYSTPSHIASQLKNIFVLLMVALDDEDIISFGETTLSVGSFMIVGASVCSATALLLAANPKLAEAFYCGAVELPFQRRREWGLRSCFRRGKARKEMTLC